MTHFIELLLVLKCFQQPEFQNERHFYALPRLNMSLRARKYNLFITFKVLSQKKRQEQSSMRED